MLCARRSHKAECWNQSLKSSHCSYLFYPFNYYSNVVYLHFLPFIHHWHSSYHQIIHLTHLSNTTRKPFHWIGNSLSYIPHYHPVRWPPSFSHWYPQCQCPHLCPLPCQQLSRQTNQCVSLQPTPWLLTCHHLRWTYGHGFISLHPIQSLSLISPPLHSHFYQYHQHPSCPLQPNSPFHPWRVRRGSLPSHVSMGNPSICWWHWVIL